MSLSWRFTTFPRSIAAGIPAFWSSPTTGAGLGGGCRGRLYVLLLVGCDARHQISSEILHRRAHRRLHVGRLIIEASSLELAHDAAHDGIQMLRVILRWHVPGPDRRMVCP